jgi:hypothetical protein
MDLAGDKELRWRQHKFIGKALGVWRMGFECGNEFRM